MNNVSFAASFQRSVHTICPSLSLSLAIYRSWSPFFKNGTSNLPFLTDSAFRNPSWISLQRTMHCPVWASMTAGISISSDERFRKACVGCCSFEMIVMACELLRRLVEGIELKSEGSDEAMQKGTDEVHKRGRSDCPFGEAHCDCALLSLLCGAHCVNST